MLAALLGSARQEVTMKIRLQSPIINFVLVLFCIPLLANGDESDSSTAVSAYPDWPQWNISVGGTWLDADGRYSLYVPDVGTIPILDFSRVGLSERDTSHYFSLSWRSRQSRWGAWFANWRFDATGSRIWSDELPIDEDTSIPVGASVISDFDAEFYIAEVTYSLFRNDRIDAGLGFGFHVVNLDTNLETTVNIDDIEIEVIKGSLDTLAPLPNVAGYAAWKIAPRWTLSGRLGWFGLSVDKFSGDMVNAHALLDFHLSERWTLGGGYQFVSFDVDIDEIEDEGYKEIYDMDFDGPVLYVSLTF
jgi:hypothetical protein